MVLGEYAGGEWQERARKAARVLGAGGDAADNPSQQVQLLTDIRAAFNGKVTMFIPPHLTDTPDGAMGEGIAIDAAVLAHDVLNGFDSVADRHGLGSSLIQCGLEFVYGFLEAGSSTKVF